MGFFKNIKDAFSSGELITDLGMHDNLSLSIRRRPSKKPHLRLCWHGPGEAECHEIVCSDEWAERFEKIAHEMRRHAGSS